MNFVRTSDGHITSVVNGQSYTVNPDHLNYKEIKEAIKTNDEQQFLRLVSVCEKVKTVVEQSGNSKVTVDNGAVYFEGLPLHNVLTSRILDLIRDEFPVDSLIKFLENVMENPSSRAVEELFDFLSHKGLPITDDGCFLAYKVVRHDYYSKTSGKLVLIQGKTDDGGHIYNGVGEVIECRRNAVDDERENECSYGLHVGALGYAGPNGWFYGEGDRVVIVKVNPKDAVSVPKDHEAQKLRVCKYEVVSEYAGNLNKPVYMHDEPYVSDKDYDDENNEEDFDEEDNTEVNYLDEIEYGDCLTFEYPSKTKGVLTRHISVSEIYTDQEAIFGMLVTPEELSGEYRRFSFNKMTNIRRE